MKKLFLLVLGVSFLAGAQDSAQTRTTRKPKSKNVQEPLPENFDVSVPVESFRVLDENPDYSLDQRNKKELRVGMGIWASPMVSNQESSLRKLDFDKSQFPSLRLDYLLSSTFENNWTQIRPIVGLSYFRFQRSTQVAGVDAPLIDAQSLNAFPINLSTEVELSRGIYRDRLHLFFVASLAPTFLYKSGSYLSNGGSDFGLLYDLGMRTEFKLDKDNSLALAFENTWGTITNYSHFSIQNVLLSYQRAL